MVLCVKLTYIKKLKDMQSQTTILVVQSIDHWLQVIRTFMGQKFPTVKTLFTNSYDKAVEISPRDGKVLVITSEMFHDEFVGDKAAIQYPNDQKNASTLAVHLKAENKNTFVYSFSEYEPEVKELLDGYILKANNYPKSLEDTIKKYL